MERGTGLEPATLCLEGRCSTAELPPLSQHYSGGWRQTGEAVYHLHWNERGEDVPAIRLKLLWLFLILLAAFVLFLEFVADVGGGSPGIPRPAPTEVPTQTPLVRPLPPDWPSLLNSNRGAQSIDSSSNTRSPLS